MPPPASRPRRALLAAVLGGALLSLGAAAPPAQLNLAGYAPSFTETFHAFDRARSDDDHGHRWRTVFGYGGPDALTNRSLPSNGEQQVYVDPGFRGLGLDPFHLIRGGGLAIRADRTPSALRGKLWDRPYTSGLITTAFSFSQMYGYFEFTAQIPHGRGLWPAFWLLPTDGSWPPEIDVVENLGHDTTTVYATAHTAARAFHAHAVQAGVDLSKGPHAYGVLWSPTELVWYLDRREVAREPTPADMHKPMYLLVNLAVGGTWPGSPDAATPFPSELRITRVAAWRAPA